MEQISLIIAIIAVIWSIVLTFFFTRFYMYYTKASAKGKKQSLIQMLDTVLGKEKQLEEEMESLKKYCLFLEERMSHQVQKIGLLRFNPFRDTGGDQSFILALVDDHDTGVIISGLHTRTGTRWYAKKITKGKSSEHELSKDEKRALKDAKPLDSTQTKSVEKK